MKKLIIIFILLMCIPVAIADVTVHGYVYSKNTGLVLSGVFVNDTFGNSYNTNVTGYYTFSSNSTTPNTQRIRGVLTGYARNDTTYNISTGEYYNLTLRQKSTVSQPGFEFIFALISILYIRRKLCISQ